MPGRFFVFDGIDGCGKSTQIARAAQRLAADGNTVVTTREPGGTPIAEKIRTLILSPDHVAMHPECELLLYGAARAQHVREKILPALAQGAIVLCDRFELATFAYQGYGRGIPMGLLERINDIAKGGCSPDLTFVFDLPVETARQRLAASGRSLDRLDAENDRFFSAVAKGFRALAASDPARIVVLDATQPVDALADVVYARMRSVIAG